MLRERRHDGVGLRDAAGGRWSATLAAAPQPDPARVLLPAVYLRSTCECSPRRLCSMVLNHRVSKFDGPGLQIAQFNQQQQCLVHCFHQQLLVSRCLVISLGAGVCTGLCMPGDGRKSEVGPMMQLPPASFSQAVTTERADPFLPMSRPQLCNSLPSRRSWKSSTRFVSSFLVILVPQCSGFPLGCQVRVQGAPLCGPWAIAAGHHSSPSQVACK